jgi:hypothetical protein
MFAGYVQKPPDRYSSLFDSRDDEDISDIPDSIEELLEEARHKQYDMPTMLRRMKSMVHLNYPHGNCAHCWLFQPDDFRLVL